MLSEPNPEKYVVNRLLSKEVVYMLYVSYTTKNFNPMKQMVAFQQS
jgi:hypothetical protein